MGCVGWRGSGCAVVTRADGARARVMYFSYSLQDCTAFEGEEDGRHAPMYNFCRRSTTMRQMGHRRMRREHPRHMHACPQGMRTHWTGAVMQTTHSLPGTPLRRFDAFLAAPAVISWAAARERICSMVVQKTTIFRAAWVQMFCVVDWAQMFLTAVMGMTR